MHACMHACMRVCVGVCVSTVPQPHSSLLHHTGYPNRLPGSDACVDIRGSKGRVKTGEALKTEHV